MPIRWKRMTPRKRETNQDGTPRKRIIGFSMLDAQEYVRDHPGCTIRRVARATGPHGSTKYGYAAVHRAIRAGLLTFTRDNRHYHLYVSNQEG